MGEVIRFIPKSERERGRLIREARAIYDSIFPPSEPVGEQRDKIIAVLCNLSSPATCHEQTVTTSDFADVSMQSCLMGAPQLADLMKLHPAERLAGWRCVFGKQDGRGA